MNVFYSSIFDCPKKEKKITSYMPQYHDYILEKEKIINKTIMGIYGLEPTLTKRQEYHLFRKFNFLKYKFQKLKEINKELADKYMTAAIKVKNHIACANLRFVFIIFKKKLKEFNLTDDHISNAFLSILKAIDDFDYRKGYRFNTFASVVIQKNHWKLKRKTSIEFSNSEEIEIASTEKNNSFESKEMINHIFQILKNEGNDRYIKIIKDYFGIETERKNMQQIADDLKITLERVRQLKLEGLSLVKKHLLLT